MRAEDNIDTGAVEAGQADRCCANCGITEIDEIKLKPCDNNCGLARYCSVECKQQHRQMHETICKERAAELRDEVLFKQPKSSHHGDCPICYLPMPLGCGEWGLQQCCGVKICGGCYFGNFDRETELGQEFKCPFCRKVMEVSDEEKKRMMMKRACANDPVILQDLGSTSYDEENYFSALNFWFMAAKLDNAQAHHRLSLMYQKGEGLEKDKDKELYHREEAAIAGHLEARHTLGLNEREKKRYDRAVKHFIIAANLGYDESIQMLKKCCIEGHVSEDDFAVALRAHQAAVDATKSPQRERFQNIAKTCG